MSDYNPYSENLKCKWCNCKIMNHRSDCQCSRCWSIVMQLSDALRIPKLLEEVKRLLEKRMEEIRLEENKETQEITQDFGFMEGLRSSIKEADAGNVISLEDAEKESFKESEN